MFTVVNYNLGFTWWFSQEVGKRRGPDPALEMPQRTEAAPSSDQRDEPLSLAPGYPSGVSITRFSLLYTFLQGQAQNIKLWHENKLENVTNIETESQIAQVVSKQTIKKIINVLRNQADSVG